MTTVSKVINPTTPNSCWTQVINLTESAAEVNPKIYVPGPCTLIDARVVLEVANDGTNPGTWKIDIEKTQAGGTELFGGTVVSGSAAGYTLALTKNAAATTNDFLIEDDYLVIESDGQGTSGVAWVQLTFQSERAAMYM